MSRVCVEISGNLLSESILDSLTIEDTKHAISKPHSFRWYKYDVLDSRSIHLARIAEAYDNLKARWDMLSSSFHEFNISELREKWLKYFFSQLGYSLEFQKADIIADSGNKFCLSHRGWQGEHVPFVHTVLYKQNLDLKPNDGRHKYSPHDTMQRYLNQSNNELWGIVTNGRELRLLRDFHHETRKAFVKFDLEAIFEGRNYSDYRLLWRLIHPSRFVQRDNGKCILESLFEESKNAGVAIGESLQKNVRLAIEDLANGFLSGTPELMDMLLDDNEKCMHFYQQILRVIYRILFLFYAEQRKLMPTKSALYAQEYSLSSLREKIELKQFVDPNHSDLWEGMKVTFQMVYHGVSELEIPAFNGQLFDPQRIELLCESKCRNDKFLNAIQHMSIFEREGLTVRISYVELSVDEIGAIYESLLEYIPRVSAKEEIFEDIVLGNRRNKERRIPPKTFFLDPRGSSRKTSGSYYTNPGLVNALIESALVPVLEDKIKVAGPNNDAQEQALLSIKVCDPACGSAAFLIAATEYLGERLAKIRTQSDYPSDMDIRHARREVLRHCIYGVDLNPMAVELAKVSLWLTAATEDLPLNFLDHRIKCGNSLIGVTPVLIDKGIPPKAYIALENDNKTLASKRIKAVRKYYKREEYKKTQIVMDIESVRYGFRESKVYDLSNITDENSTEAIREIRELYRKSREEIHFLRKKFIADYWTATFFWQHINENEEYPRPEGLDYQLSNKNIEVDHSLKAKINEIASDYKFFHWHLEFPEVFASGGFDCILGNPPWEKLTIFEREFFVGKDDNIAKTQKKSDRGEKIEKLKINNPDLYLLWQKARNEFSRKTNWFRNCMNFCLSAVGELNTYPLFTELGLNLVNKNGRVGLIIKSALATGFTYSTLFNYLLIEKRLISFFDFKNWKMLFPIGFHERYALMTLIGEANGSAKFQFAFECLDINDIEKKTYSLSLEQIEKFNPNTKTCPVFLDSKDIKLAEKLYTRFRILFDESKKINEWGIRCLSGYHMSQASYLFFKKEELIDKGYVRQNNCFIQGKSVFVPLYEGKFIQNYDYRFASFENVSKEKRFGKKPATYTPTSDQKGSINYEIEPRYWVDQNEHIRYRNAVNLYHNYHFAYRLVTNVISNARTCIGCIMPAYPTNNLCMALTVDGLDSVEYTRRILLFQTIFSSFVFDYFARQKVTENLLNNVLYQLPIPPPKFFSSKTIGNKTLEDFLIEKSIELTVCTTKLKDVVIKLGISDMPHTWDEEQHVIAKTTIDAVMAFVYGLTYDKLEYILETFPIVKRKDTDRYGDFRSKKMILAKYQELKSKLKYLLESENE